MNRNETAFLASQSTRMSIWCAVIALCGLFFCLDPFAFGLDLPSEYLDREFDWCVYVDANQVEGYFNYEGSKLNPLTKVVVSIRKSQRNATLKSEPQKRTYAEFWYHNGKPVGMQKKSELDLDRGESGTIILRTSTGTPHDITSGANAILRTFVHLQQCGVTTVLVMVPQEHYQTVVQTFGEYGFFRGSRVSAGRQLSLNLRSCPEGTEDRLSLIH